MKKHIMINTGISAVLAMVNLYSMTLGSPFSEYMTIDSLFERNIGFSIRGLGIESWLHLNRGLSIVEFTLIQFLVVFVLLELLVLSIFLLKKGMKFILKWTSK